MKYKYYSTQRPIDIGTYPKPPEAPEVEFEFYSGRLPVENGAFQAWGALTYSAPLTEEQIAAYELQPSRDNPDVKERMSVQAQAVGAWESRNRVPIEKRLTCWDSNAQAYEPLAHTTIKQLERQFQLALEFPTVSLYTKKTKQKKPPQRGGR